MEFSLTNGNATSVNSDIYPDDEALTFWQGVNSQSNDLNLAN